MGNTTTKTSRIVIGYKETSSEQQQQQQQHQLVDNEEEDFEGNQVVVRQSSLHKFSLNLSNSHLISLVSSPLLTSQSLRVLNLSHNSLKELPDIFNQFPNLIAIDVSHNQLTHLPSSISSLKCLMELRAERNKITEFPMFLCKIKTLIKINLSYNAIENIPTEVRALRNLSSLKLNGTFVKYLPIEINLIPVLRDVSLEGCPLITSEDSEEVRSQNNNKSSVPSLKELCARRIQKDQVMFEENTLPVDLENYLSSCKECSFCNGPYFEHHTQKVRFITKWGQQQPFVYHLCETHFRSEKQRIFEMFRPRTSSQPIFIKQKPKNKVMERSKSNLLANPEDKVMKKAHSSSFHA